MKLINPTIELKVQYIEMMKDWERTGENLVPFPIKYDYASFEDLVDKQSRFNEQTDPGFVSHSTYWLIDNDKNILGVSNLRHYLNTGLLNHGGHIGYGIKPSERRKGYATKILELSLMEAKKIGIEKALITCDHDNIASEKTILKNGGQFWKLNVQKDGKKIKLFWIPIG